MLPYDWSICNNIAKSLMIRGGQYAKEREPKTETSLHCRLSDARNGRRIGREGTTTPRRFDISDIEEHLEDAGIEAEKHSIRRDIDLLNGIYKDKDKNVVHFDPLMDIRGGKGKPIYLGSRYLPFEDLEIIAECIASANFISRPEAEELIEKLKNCVADFRPKG